MNIYKNFKKFKLLKKLIIILAIILLLLIFTNIKFKREGFTVQKKLFDIKRGMDLFDAPYVEIYDNLVHNPTKNNYEVDRVLQIKVPATNLTLLDVGCGTGHHVNLFNKKNIKVIGIDRSEAMIKKAQKNIRFLY